MYLQGNHGFSTSILVGLPGQIYRWLSEAPDTLFVRQQSAPAPRVQHRDSQGGGSYQSPGSGKLT